MLSHRMRPNLSQNKQSWANRTVKKLFESLILRSSLTVFFLLLVTSLNLFSKPVSLIITARNSADWSPEFISASHEIESLIMSSVGMPSTTIILNPKSPRDLKLKLRQLLAPGDYIAKMVIVGHGSDSKDGFHLWIGREPIKVSDSSTNNEIREIFAPLHDRFAAGAMIHLSGCSLLSDDPKISELRIRNLRDIFGLKTGSIYANTGFGDDAAYYNTNWSFLKSRKHLISERIFSSVMMAFGMLGFSGSHIDQLLTPDLPLWTKMGAALTIPTLTLIQLFKERWDGYRTRGIVGQFSSENLEPRSQTRISERSHFFKHFLELGKPFSKGHTTLDCRQLF